MAARVDGLAKNGRLLGISVGAKYIRTLVSKSRRRLITDGYDLDMSYITDRLVAMSYPAQNMQSLIRNPMWQVKRVLDKRHGAHYKVCMYDACSCAAFVSPCFASLVACFVVHRQAPLNLLLAME